MKITEVQLSRVVRLKEFWQTVDPVSVIPRLSSWSCGTQACLGGHAVHVPEFKADGLRAAPSGVPVMVFAHVAPNIFEYFGSQTIFDPRGASSYDRLILDYSPECSDWELADRRMALFLAENGVKAEVQQVATSLECDEMSSHG